MLRKNNAGYTMLEIIMTMIIATSLMTLGVLSMTSYLPKQRLLDSVETVEQTLSRAQYEATSRSVWSCIKYDTATNKLSVYMDSNNDHVAQGPAGCGNTGDILITTQQLRTNVTLASGCSFSFTTSPLWFDTAGVPKNCVVGSGCSPYNAQIVVTSTKLPTGNCAREVEAISSGLIKIVPRGEKGYDESIYAKSNTLTTGACEGSCL